ncbi:hypothetical protein ACHHYP_20215 [Achlya hypogyna]|uniref:Uncharacterized protein n=1 Tax=Achlya hypogyna TaxID=1202772 RepID=A0A1V9ZNS8_ACHHY|nr:hypothetical protein ACHHYP_20215 [Achlya hypogyna]
MDNAIWRAVLVSQCHVKPEKLKPKTKVRLMLATLLAKNRCNHCGDVPTEGCTTIRVHTENYGQKLCKTCFRLPLYQEISHGWAVREFGIEGWHLARLHCRVVANGFDRMKMYNRQAVIDLVQLLQSSPQEPEHQEIAHAAAVEKFKLKPALLTSLPHRLVAAGNGHNRKLYNLRAVMDLAAASGCVPVVLSPK